MKSFRPLFCWITAAMLAATSLPLLADGPLKVGDKAPRFSCADQDGHTWRLRSHLGKKMVLLCFYPENDTAASVTEACGLCDNMFEFKAAGVDVVGVSCNSKKAQKDFVFKYNLDFPVLADKHGGIADDYGVLRDNPKKMDRRVSFLIGMDGTIMHITDSPDAYAHLKEMAMTLAKLSAPIPK